MKNGEKQNNISLKAFEIYKKIREQHPEASIIVLARYKDVIKDQNVKFWTFHSSKGLDADYCILLEFFQGKTSSPNENKEEAVSKRYCQCLMTTLIQKNALSFM